MKAKRKFYMEWWVLGDDSKAIQARTFHSAHVEAFVQHFLDCKKYHIVHFEQLDHYRKVIFTRRAIQHATA